MNILNSKISELKENISGFSSENSTIEQKIIFEMSTLLCDMSKKIEDLEEEKLKLQEYIEAVDSDLCDIKDELYGNDDCI